MQEVVNGNNRKWELISKISEGDAGEIYSVKAIGTEITGILKRPTTSPFDSARQLKQLRSEKEILDALGVGYKKEKAAIKPVKLLDHGDDDRFFIIMEKATGFSLSALHKISNNEISINDLLGYSQVEQHFAINIAKAKRIPQYLILRVLLELLNFLDRIHSLENFGADNSGIVWNDVKPDHIFWNPIFQQITIIDWGNAQFLGQNGITQNGSMDANADIFQYVEGMGAYVKMVSPELARRLGWANSSNMKNILGDVPFLRKAILGELRDYEQQIQKYRSKEKKIYQSQPSVTQLPDLIEVHENILRLGECPDYKTSREYNSELISQLSRQQDFEDCVVVLDSKTLLYEDNGQQQIIEELIFNGIPQRPIYFSKAIELAANEFASSPDWEDVFWNIHLAFVDDVNALSSKKRLLHALAAKLNKQVESVLESVLYNKLVELKDKLEGKKRKSRTDKLSKACKELDSVIGEWELQDAKEGMISGFSIGYGSFKDLIDTVLHLDDDDLLKDVNEISQYINDFEKNIESVLSAWGKMDFLKAREELRTLHKWDPKWLRVFTADRLLAKASLWIAETQTGKSKTHAALLDEGKELRYFFGKAEWLDERIKRLESILNPDKQGWLKAKKNRQEKPVPVTSSSLTTSPKNNISAVNVTDITHPTPIQDGRELEPTTSTPVNPDVTHRSFFVFLREREWAKAERMLEDGSFQENATVAYRTIVETFKKIDTCKDITINWSDLVDSLEKNMPCERFAGEITKAWLVVEALQKKNWNQPTAIDAKLYERIIKSIGALQKFSEARWRDKLSQVQIKPINDLITSLKVRNQSVPEMVLLPYLISIATKAVKYVEDTSQALDKFKRHKDKETSYTLLETVKKLETHLISDPPQPNKWLQEYEDVVIRNRSIDVDLENPAFDFLKPKVQPSMWDFGVLLKSFLTTGLITGCILAAFFIGTEFFWGDGRYYSIVSDFFQPSSTPKFESPVAPTSPVIAFFPTPTMTFTPEVSQFAFDCEDASIYSKERRWTEYSDALDLISEDQYEKLRHDCGWSQNYRPRKLDVALRNLQSLPSDQISEAKKNLVENIEQMSWPQTAKYIDESSDADLLIRSQRLRGILASCNAAEVRIPVDSTDTLISDLSQNYFSLELKEVFKELCQQSPENFLQTTVLLDEVTAEDSVLNLLSMAPPYDMEAHPCFYNDQSEVGGVHYRGSEKDCPIVTINNKRKTDFMDFSMCIVELKQPGAFAYGVSFLQKEKKYTLFIEDKEGTSSVLTGTEFGVFIFDPENTFTTFRIGCDKNLEAQAIILGNLLVWRYRVGREFVYVRDAQVLDDEFIQEPLTISMFGYMVDGPATGDLHFYIKKFDVKQGAPQ